MANFARTCHRLSGVCLVLRTRSYAFAQSLEQTLDSGDLVRQAEQVSIETANVILEASKEYQDANEQRDYGDRIERPGNLHASRSQIDRAVVGASILATPIPLLQQLPQLQMR